MLKGKLTGLRAIERADLPSLLAWRNMPEFRRFFREYRELNGEQHARWFETAVCGDPKTLMFSIVRIDTGALLGAAGLCYVNWVDRNADFSIYIGADGRYVDGTYAPDAAKTLIAYAFGELGLHRLWTEIYSIDAKKRKLFTDLGFSIDGVHRQTHWTDGRWVDSIYFSLLAGESGHSRAAKGRSRA